jgi:hypothetical protein
MCASRGDLRKSNLSGVCSSWRRIVREKSGGAKKSGLDPVVPSRYILRPRLTKSLATIVETGRGRAPRGPQSAVLPHSRPRILALLAAADKRRSLAHLGALGNLVLAELVTGTGLLAKGEPR